MEEDRYAGYLGMGLMMCESDRDGAMEVKKRGKMGNAGMFRFA